MPTPTHLKFKTRFGPWAVVTGASSGIGRAMAEELAAHGLDLVLVARREAELKSLAARLTAQHACNVRLIVADLSLPEGINQVISETHNLTVGLLVAAAGFGTSGEFIQANWADESAMLHVNCLATTALTLHFARQFAALKRGGLVLFGSLVGYQGTPHAAHYAATKAYVQTLAEGLHIELKPRGVSVLAVAPGPVLSEFGHRAKMTIKLGDQPQTVARETLAQLGKKMTVTPGTIGKLLTWSLHTAPRSLRVRIMNQIMGSMTNHRTLGTTHAK